ncbi:MAG: hypothetical protein K2X81_29750, partial [Candidatus Obscuribacterales bacterium]|nr:hypothetical protein [Candidatus Obscuribacterales bacterium]
MHNSPMENAEQTQLTSEEVWGPFQLKANPRALFRLSLGTAAAIATALLIPDAIALIPNVPNAFVWFCRCVGLWGYAYVLWATGFLCLLHLVRIFGGSIVLDSNGIKLGRIGGIIPWASIKAISVSERKVFSKIFFTPSYQMNVHTMKPDGKYAAKQLASFQYLPEEFYTLFYYISKNAVGIEPASLQACVFTDAANIELKKSAEQA